MTDRAPPVVVASVLERDAGVALARVRLLPPECGLVELRADLLPPDRLAELVRQVARPVIVSARRQADGGSFSGSEVERRALLERALDAGAALIDVEWGSPAAELAEGARSQQVILSHHGAACRREALASVHRSMAAGTAGRLKLVPRAESVGELAALRELLERTARDRAPLACFASGRSGRLSRLLAPAWGSWATYGAAASGAETGEGQFTAAELVGVYDVLGIRPATRLFGLVGRDLDPSPSPAMHQAAYRALGLDARLLPVEPERLSELDPLIGGSGGLAGLAVTIPFKQDAARRATPCDEVSAAAGAVNTVVFDGPRWQGYNTDGPAAAALVGRHLELRDARIAVVGAGGTGRALTAAFKFAGARVTVFNRSRSRGRDAAKLLGAAYRGLDELAGAAWDVLAQATPLGRLGERVLPAERLTGRVVLDAAYGRETTPLVREARERGLATVDGFEMLVQQGVAQIERLTGLRPETEWLERAGREWLRRSRPRS